MSSVSARNQKVKFAIARYEEADGEVGFGPLDAFWAEDYASYVSEQVDVEAHVQAKQLRAAIEEVLFMITARQAQVIRERFISELTRVEIGKKMHVSPVRVREIEHNALRRIRVLAVGVHAKIVEFYDRDAVWSYTHRRWRF